MHFNFFHSYDFMLNIINFRFSLIVYDYNFNSYKMNSFLCNLTSVLTAKEYHMTQIQFSWVSALMKVYVLIVIFEKQGKSTTKIKHKKDFL